MKKFLAAMTCGIIFATTASADLARVEMGVGAWMQTPSGEISYSDSGATGTDKSTQTQNTEGYVWLLLKHPVPIIPNIRLEYTSLTNTGLGEGSFNDFTIPTGETTKTTLDMTQFDIIPYYNILDNTFWTTVDLGVDLKVINSSYKAEAVVPLIGVPFAGYSDSVSIVLPMLYLRGRVEIPATDIGLEADVKYVSYNSSTVYDVRAKVDYTLDFIPVIQPAIEVGYRVQKMKIETDDDKTKMDLDFAGVYAGLMLRF